jgi:hypothetical protein
MTAGNMAPQSRSRVPLGILFFVTASRQTISGYQVKAAFLYDLTKFVEWPALTFETDKDRLPFGVLRQNRFGHAFVEALDSKTIVGRPLSISDISDVTQSANCQILFIGSSERKSPRAIFAELRTVGVPTVGETEEFATQGDRQPQVGRRAGPRGNQH